MPKPKKTLIIKNEDILQIQYSYQTGGKKHKFSLCYQFNLLVPTKEPLEIKDRALVQGLNNLFLKNNLLNNISL